MYDIIVFIDGKRSVFHFASEDVLHSIIEICEDCNWPYSYQKSEA